MTRRKQGRCIACDERRALTVDMCDSCEEQERFGQEQHENLQQWLNSQPPIDEAE